MTYMHSNSANDTVRSAWRSHGRLLTARSDSAEAGNARRELSFQLETLMRTRDRVMARVNGLIANANCPAERPGSIEALRDQLGYFDQFIRRLEAGPTAGITAIPLHDLADLTREARSVDHALNRALDYVLAAFAVATPFDVSGRALSFGSERQGATEDEARPDVEPPESDLQSSRVLAEFPLASARERLQEAVDVEQEFRASRAGDPSRESSDNDAATARRSQEEEDRQLAQMLADHQVAERLDTDAAFALQLYGEEKERVAQENADFQYAESLERKHIGRAG